jgi:membrane dipeptidase
MQVVQEMNRLGMMVDVSHISDEAFYDVLEITTAPVIASHSNAKSIYDHPRNMSDTMLNALAKNGGVIQVPLLYVKAPDPENPPTVSDVVDHIDHIVEVAGIDHVGIGTDFDGGGEVEGCFDVSEMPNITIELVKRGYSEDQIRKIWGGNFMRVFKEVEESAGK